MTTPAQATGHPDFVTDWPIQGPTDQGIREADCYYMKHFLPTRPSCVDCGDGVIPMFAQRNRLAAFGMGDAVMLGGRGALGFADTGLAAAGDPDIWNSLSHDQQTWITDTLVRLNTLITTTTNSKCLTWAPAIGPASQCFQMWFNSVNQGAPIKMLRTDGVFDQDTLDALLVTTQIHSKDFPTPYPAKKKLSTGAMVGIAAGGAAVVGGIVYLVTRK